MDQRKKDESQKEVAGKSKNIVPLAVKEEAVKLLVPEADEKTKAKLFDYIEKQFKNLSCCVLYSASPKFNSLCLSLGIDIGKKEVKILPNFSLAYTNNYETHPKKL